MQFTKSLKKEIKTFSILKTNQKNQPEEILPTGFPFQKFFKKKLDKPLNPCYNIVCAF